MKARYFYLGMMSLALTMGFTACSDDDDNDIDLPVPNEIQRTDLTVDADTVQVEVGSTATFNITGGNEDYKVFSENDEIATASISGNTVTVTSQKKGIAGVVISDSKGARKRVMVKSMYLHMELDKSEVLLGIKRGHKDGRATVTVTKGNGNYTAVVDDEKVCTASVSGDVVTLNAVAKGQTKVTVTDMMGLSQTVTVTVEETTVAFTDDEKNEILAQTEDIISWNGEESYNWGTFSAKTEGGTTTVNWDYYGYYYCTLTYSGDLTAGKKGKGTLKTKMSWYDDGSSYEDIDVEVLKNDGKTVWGIMSKLTDDYLYTGYFVVKL